MSKVFTFGSRGDRVATIAARLERVTRYLTEIGTTPGWVDDEELRGKWDRGFALKQTLESRLGVMCSVWLREVK